MNRNLIFVTILMVAGLVPLPNPSCLAQNQAKDYQTQRLQECKLPDVRDALAKRVAEDQEARFAVIKLSSPDQSKENADDPDSIRRKELFDRSLKIDKENTQWLEEQIKVHGWLGKSLVGTGGAHNAWLLVQHADLNKAFQRKCLELMTDLPKGEVAPIDIAYLTDRVLAGEGKPQRYGTQCTMENGKATVQKVEDPEKLNERRAELGLEPIEKYLKQIEEVYGSRQSNKDHDK